MDNDDFPFYAVFVSDGLNVLRQGFAVSLQGSHDLEKRTSKRLLKLPEPAPLQFQRGAARWQCREKAESGLSEALS